MLLDWRIEMGGPILTVLFCLAYGAFAFTNGVILGEHNLKQEAVAHGYGHYDVKDNQFHWNNEDQK